MAYDTKEIAEILIQVGAGAGSATAVMQAIKMYKNRHGDKADLLTKLDKALAEVHETNLGLRNEILELREKLANCQKQL